MRFDDFINEPPKRFDLTACSPRKAVAPVNSVPKKVASGRSRQAFSASRNQAIGTVRTWSLLERLRPWRYPRGRRSL